MAPGASPDSAPTTHPTTFDPTPAGSPDGRLSVGPVAPGVPVRFTVRRLAPGTATTVAWSVVGPGSARLGDLQTGLADPLVVERVFADASFSATAEVVLDVAGAERVWAQALTVAPDGAQTLTEVVVRPVFDPTDVWVGDLVLGTPGDVVASSAVQAVTGDVRAAETRLTALSLPALVQVGGDLVVWENDALATLDLAALRWVSGDLSVYADPALAGVNSPALEAVGGTLALHHLETLLDLDGLAATQTVGGLYLHADPALSRVELPALVVVDGDLDGWELPALEQLTVPALTTVAGRLDLFVVPSLDALRFPALTTLGAFRVRHADAIPDAGEVHGLVAVGEVELAWNDALASLDGWSRVETMDGLRLEGLPSLTTVGGLSSLTRVQGELSVLRVPALPALDLPALTSCGDLDVHDNPGLVAPGLPALTEVRRTVRLDDNRSLSTCSVEAWLAGVEVGGAVSCGGNLADGCAPACVAAR